jgi:phage terminase large subunit-like protein
MILPFKGYDTDIIPRKETIEFFLWLKTNFDETNESAVAHYFMIDHINSTSTKFKGVMASRGLSKTTTIGVYYMAFLLWKGSKPNITTFRSAIYVMDTITKAKQVLRRVIDIIEEKPELFSDRFKVNRSNLGDDPMLEIYHYKENRKMWFFVRGMGQSLRGTNVKERPDLIFFDDVESEQNAGTDETRAKNLQWFFANALPAGRMGDTEFIFIGTPMHKNSLIVLLSDENGDSKKKLVEEFGIPEEFIPEWEFIKIPIAQKFPVDNVDEIVSAWNDRFPPKEIMRTYSQYLLAGAGNIFFQEYMLDLKNEANSIYNIDAIRFIEDKLDTSSMSIYISIDLNAKEKSTSDYGSVAVIGIDANSGHWFLIDGIAGHLGVDEILMHIFMFHLKYRSTEVLFESVVFTTLFEYILNKEMINRGIFLNINTFSRTVNKLSVFKQFSAIVNNGAFWIARKDNEIYNEFIDELLNEEMPFITREAILASRDDVLDSIAQLVLANVILPSSEPIEDNGDIDDWNNPYDY